MIYEWTVTVGGVDISHLVETGGSIDYGKPTRFSSFQAPVAVFQLLTKDENPQPAPASWPVIHLGDPVVIHVTHDGVTQHRRFTGLVQALDYSIYALRVTATGAATDWGSAWSGYTYQITGMPLPFDPTIPVQTETDRVQRWVGFAGRTITIEGVAARWLREVPPETTGEPLLDVLLRIADDCDGLLMEDRLGVMHYRTWNFQRPARVVLPPHLVESETLDMAIERGTLTNMVTVFYGEPDPSTGVQAEVTVKDQQSIDKYGTHNTQIATDIQYAKGAAGKGQKFLERNQLSWEAPDVTLIMRNATAAEADTILNLQENWRVTLSPLPVGSPIPAFDGDILGFTEIMHDTDYRMILHLGPPVGDEAAPPEEPIFLEDSLTGGSVTFYEDQFAHRYQLHTFATVGAFTLECVHPVTVDALVVAGGGGGASGGGAGDSGGGGGAGRAFYGALSFTAGTIAVTVGAGGGAGADGSPSTLAGITLPGGGAGGGSTQPGHSGGSGGGGGTGAAGGAAVDGTGHTGTVGHAGGSSPGGGQGGGGGGAGTAGTYPGGGAGIATEITGTAVTVARGGRGGGNGVTAVTPTGAGSGGSGGGYFFGGGTAGNGGAVYVRYRVG